MSHGKPHTEEAKRKISESMKKAHRKSNWWKGREHKESTKRILSEKQKAKWRNPTYRITQGSAQARKPTKAEKRLLTLLNKWFPNEWMYVGDEALFIEGRNPDYVNKNGQRKVIELFGEYWHEEGEVAAYDKFYTSIGYKCLVVWVSEFKDLPTLRYKLTEFTNAK